MEYGMPPPGYRLPNATRLGAVRLLVSDLQRSADYYQHVIGLQITSRQPDAVTLGTPGDSATLLELRHQRGVRPVPQSERVGLYHFALLVPDRADLGRFVSHLRTLGVPVASADHAVSEAIYLWDPDGLGIEVYADRPRDTWRRNGRELFMTTERLDLRALMLAGGDVKWNGLPRGTVLGHMHLHVGDLEASARFYHAALGFDQIVWSYPGALFLSAGGYHHHLGTNAWAGDAPLRADDEAGLLEWEIVLPTAEDCAAAARSCESAGFATTREADAIAVDDPWRTRVRLIGGM